MRYVHNIVTGQTDELPDLPVPPAPPPPTQFELDENRYRRRAAVKDQLLAYMAADNMSRIRAGVWTVPELSGLLADPAVQAANAYMQTLSYELAAQSIAAATTPLLTPEIKADWIAMLTEHFYLVP
jgi:hypothetical protein